MMSIPRIYLFMPVISWYISKLPMSQIFQTIFFMKSSLYEQMFWFHGSSTQNMYKGQMYTFHVHTYMKVKVCRPKIRSLCKKELFPQEGGRSKAFLFSFFLQSILAIRNLLVTTKLFLKTKRSLLPIAHAISIISVGKRNLKEKLYYVPPQKNC